MFHDLVLAIVDEQHRFGVHQRLAITAKGNAPDMLVMTATPIPRTLVLTAFGDMDVSKLTEKPAGRQPIQTVTLPLERMGELVERMRRAVAEGQKIYWICPLVEESEEIKLMSAEDRFAMLQPVFGNIVGLVHGRMSGRDKDEAMRAFKAGETRILVGTTVIEVGVDVPDATIMVIEHAERFGLAQLHQLRGRVGRGDKPSTCVLLYKAPLGETAMRRLQVMRETEDGFRISEEDLKLRGEGEVLGTRQSGTPGFQVARIEAHADLLEVARDDARLLLSRDPELQGERGAAIRLLLYLVRARRGGTAAARRLNGRCRNDAGRGRLAQHLRPGPWRPEFGHDQPGRDHRLRRILDRHRQFDDVGFRQIHQEAGGRVRRARHEHGDGRIVAIIQLAVDFAVFFAGNEDDRPDALARVFDDADLGEHVGLVRQHGLENLLQRRCRCCARSGMRLSRDSP